MTIDEIENRSLITIDEGGAIRYESIARKEFNGDWDLLLRCIEENINSNPAYGESIYWYGVRRDYEAIK